MPQLFNANSPTSLGAIQNYIASYTTPEAAESDTLANAPQGADYLSKQYQALTGDAFADPFADAKRAHDAAIMQAAAGGASVAVGGNRGASLLTAPDIIASGNTATPPIATRLGANGFPLSRTANRMTENSLLTDMLQKQGRDYQLAGSDVLIPNPKANDYLQILEKRANLSGAGDLWREIYRNDPTVFDSGTASDDPRFARVQGGKDGKVEAADALHPIASNPKFMEEARRDPKKAAALYSAVTNGRDYNTDITAKSQLLAEQRDSRKKIIESIKNVEADPVTGELFKVQEVKDLAGNLTQQRVPLLPLDKAAIQSEGGFKRIFGMDLPDRAGLAALPGMTGDEHAEYKQRTQELRKSNPALTVGAASKMAHKQMFEAQQQKIATLQSGSNPGGRPGFIRAADTIGQFMTGAANALIKGNPLDAMLGTPERPYTVPSNESLDTSWNNFSDSIPTTGAVGEETKRYWMEKMGLTIPTHGTGSSW